MTLNEITILFFDDWAALFNNGKLVDQNHYMPYSAVSPFCPIGKITVLGAEYYEHLGAAVAYCGSFPDDITLEDALSFGKTLYLEDEKFREEIESDSISF